MTFKNNDLMLFGVAAVSVFIIYNAWKAKKAGGSTSTGKLTPWASQIAQADGWQYFSDGTSISPDGKYYKGSDMVYDPSGMYGATT